jgi:hypothetical protein
MLPFGLVVLVVGTLVVANAWAVIDARLVASSAAREAVRTYVETGSDGAGAWRAAEQAATAVMVDAGRDPNRFRLEPVAVVRGALSRCARVVVVASYEVPALTVPFVGGFADGITVEARASEVVDPYRSGLSGGGCG